MPFIPHSQDDIEQMLARIGVVKTDDLFDEIPEDLRIKQLDAVPVGQNEWEVSQTMRAFSEQDRGVVCFAGGGAYDHHIPSAVWQITTRGEFYTAYTPYQAEASQGSLQLIYEYQSMMCGLLGMEVSNASLYDGATALAEAVLMAVRANRTAKSKQILVPENLNPAWRQVLESIVIMQGIELTTLAIDAEKGCSDLTFLNTLEDQKFAAVVAVQPGFTGVLEPVNELVDWAQTNGALSIAVVNPLAMTVIVPPGEWGENGVDIAVGEGQPLGIPLSSGGPYFGFMACRKALVRQMPGRIVGRTTDLNDEQGFTLTLQAREQHIRRAKATSNICTNQGLMVTAATIHMSVMGDAGLKSAAEASHQNMLLLDQKLHKAGIKRLFNGAFFNEAVYVLEQPGQQAIKQLAKDRVLAGVHLQTMADRSTTPALAEQLNNSVLICTTEKRTEQEMDRLVALLAAL